MYNQAPLAYRLPAQYFPFGPDWNPNFEKLLPPARGWNGNVWPHRDDGYGLEDKIANSLCAPRFADCKPAPAKLLASDGLAATEVSEFFSRLQFHFLAKYGEQGAALRAHMLFEIYGPVRNVDPKVLFREDADGDAWSGAINSLKS